MSNALDDIRASIDSLDDQIHDLLMKRADLIMDVSEAKRALNQPIVQPAREAAMIRRLLARHRGPLPDAAIVGIWRELVGAVSLLQTGIKVVVAQGPGMEDRWDMAKQYFGTVLPMSRQPTSMNALGALRDDAASFAVVPWPLEGDVAPWWGFLMGQDNHNGHQNPLRIVGALPYGAERPLREVEQKALVVARSEFSASGDDNSFIALTTQEPVSRARLIDSFKSQDLPPINMFGPGDNQSPGLRLHCIEVPGYVADRDKRVKGVAKKFEDLGGRCAVLGGYAVPPIYRAFKRVGRKTKKAA